MVKIGSKANPSPPVASTAPTVTENRQGNGGAQAPVATETKAKTQRNSPRSMIRVDEDRVFQFIEARQDQEQYRTLWRIIHRNSGLRATGMLAALRLMIEKIGEEGA